MAPPTLYLCKGKHCSASKRDRRTLVDAVSNLAIVERTRCQKICDGPVAGIDTDQGRLWFARLDTPKSRRRLRELLETGRLRKALKKRIRRGRD